MCSDSTSVVEVFTSLAIKTCPNQQRCILFISFCRGGCLKMIALKDVCLLGSNLLYSHIEEQAIKLLCALQQGILEKYRTSDVWCPQSRKLYNTLEICWLDGCNFPGELVMLGQLAFSWKAKLYTCSLLTWWVHFSSWTHHVGPANLALESKALQSQFSALMGPLFKLFS